MIINIKDILDEIDRSWDEPVDVINEIFDHEPHNTTKLLTPFHINMHLRKLGEDLDITGNFHVKVSFNCDRCCDESILEWQEDFHFLLLPKKEEKEDNWEEEVDLSYYEGEDIDLSDYIRELFFLSLPYKLLCKEDCKGICPNCGANLNRERCTCNGQNSSNPFHILRK